MIFAVLMSEPSIICGARYLTVILGRPPLLGDHAWVTRVPPRALHRTRSIWIVAVLLAAEAVGLSAQTGSAPSPSIAYRLSFPQREHRLMDVAVTFTGVPDGPLRLHMSRSSPGRYALRSEEHT